MDKDTTKITNIPKKESREWKRNESIINKSPTLKRMRDIQQGFKPSSTIRVADNSQAYKDGWDRIFGNKENKDQENMFSIGLSDNNMNNYNSQSKGKLAAPLY